MTRATIFWVIMLILLFFGGFIYWPHGGGGFAYGPVGIHFVAWVLFALLGWNVFGPAIKG